MRLQLMTLLLLSSLLFADAFWESKCYRATKDEICKGTRLAMPYMDTRSPGVNVTVQLFLWNFCDVFAIDSGQWYMSRSKMIEECPDMYKCGTKFPIWLQGRNPRPEEGLVNLTACMRWYEDCCPWTYSIVAVNCGDSMAYCFNELPSGCHQRYCFDVDKRDRSPDVYNDQSEPKEPTRNVLLETTTRRQEMQTENKKKQNIRANRCAKNRSCVRKKMTPEKQKKRLDKLNKRIRKLQSEISICIKNKSCGKAKKKNYILQKKIQKRSRLSKKLSAHFNSVKSTNDY